jgi:hypothetical protein
LKNWLKIQVLDVQPVPQGTTMQFAVKLTARQQQILDLIQSAIARTGAPPTVPKSRASWAFAPPTRPRNTCRRWPARASSNS